MKGFIIIVIVLAFTGIASAQDYTSVTLTWTAPGDDGNVGTAYEYDVRYYDAPITALNWDGCTQADGEPAPQEAGSTESFTVDSLLYNSTYYFAVKTRDEAGNWSGLSNIAEVATTDNIAPAAIMDLEATESR